MEDFKSKPAFFLHKNLWGNGSYAAVLDENFAVQAVSKIEVRGDLDWKHAIADVRLWVSPEGDVIITFLPYFLGEIRNPLIAKLHLSATTDSDSDYGFRAWINRHEVRRPQYCDHPKTPMKTLWFVRSNDRAQQPTKLSTRLGVVLGDRCRMFSCTMVHPRFG